MNYHITEKNLAAHEWIGLSARVSGSADMHKRGLSGTIIDETKNTLQLETSRGIKTIPKAEVHLQVKLESGWTDLNTSEWCFAPENRTKAFFKKKGRK